MNDFRIEPHWIAAGVALLLVGAGAYVGFGAYRRRSRRKALLRRLQRIAYEAVHQVLVPDGMGGFIHILLVVAIIMILVRLAQGKSV